MNREDIREIDFWSFVDIKGEDDCWNWFGGSCRGYGVFRVRRVERAHRISWVLDRNKQIPDLFEKLPAEICHICDNKKMC